MRRVVTLTILIIPIFISCIVDSGEFGSSLSGIVTDSVTGLPIESALVHTGDTTRERSAVTDSSGAYAWSDFGYGPTTVLVRKAGYLTGTRTFAKWSGDKKGVDFRLVPE